MEKKLLSVRTVVAVGIGAAIMFVLMRFVAIPSGVPNTNLNLSSAIVVFFGAVFGPLAGLLIAFIGHALTDLTWGGVWWSWVIADAIFGLLAGIFWTRYGIEEGKFGVKSAVFFNIVQIAANLIAWVGVAPTLDILIYQEPADKVYIQGLTAAGLNSLVVLILGTILAVGYSRTRTKAGSLQVETSDSPVVNTTNTAGATKGNSGMAILALIFGILGICGGAIPTVQYFTGLLSILAIILGAIDRKNAIKTGQPSGMATAGMVLGIIATVITIIAIIVIVVLAGALFSAFVNG
ncbi:MAG: ECF-type riboflavin transporter substrate-binding protein [Treponema sp.]|jgi:energy-coupling factor transport system substrate-specific component|nr:ECF-type riboflavin transporter substrate-binding protein [Treponema sp.]